MSTKDPPNSSLWYTRRGTVVQGPFPAGLIRRYAILGRVRMSDELSQDLETWSPLECLPELIPDFMRAGDDDIRMQRRLLAAKRWEDERRQLERRDESEALQDERRGDNDRRLGDDDGPPPRLPARGVNVPDFPQRHRRALIAGLLAVVIATVVFLYQSRHDEIVDGADCSQSPRPEVNWNNCAMEGRNLNGADLASAHMSSMALSRANLGSARLRDADLSFSNLSVASLRAADLASARLTGASLRAADLSGANLENSDLSYADLRNASLEGARLTGARLDNAMWIDGSECLPGSVGACLVVP